MISDPSDLRVLWLSPWMRPLARIYCELLLDAGAQVLLVTSDRHPNSDLARPYEMVLDPRPKTLRTWPQWVRGAAVTRRFDANVVVSELVRDPRWIWFAGRAPRVELIHDDNPHDAGEVRPRWEQFLFGKWSQGAAEHVAFSHYVAAEVGASVVVPLVSDVEGALVPPLVPAQARRDFVLIGRLNGYKNIDVCLQAWRQHTAGSGWREDRLLLIGDGDWRRPLPPYVVRRPGRFRYEGLVPVLARAKGSLVHYRRASQSGVQVLAMQLGVTPIVSTVGALPEFAPPNENPIGVDDVEGLARAFDSLADPEEAMRRGASARSHYLKHFSTRAARGPLLDVIESNAKQRAATSIEAERLPL